jgi:hypothetical protein
MDDRDNYHTPERTYTAVRVPQVEKNLKLKRRILAGEVDQAEALRLERDCLEALAAYGRRVRELEVTLSALREYEQLHDGRIDRGDIYRVTLGDRPWESCPCAICRQVGIHVVIFRGAERNRRRGFHNLWVLYRKLQDTLGDESNS